MTLPAIPFLLIRHGETELNAKRICCGGGVDTILTEQGRQQADTAGRLLAALPEERKPTLIVHSDMSRTRETAAIVNRHLNLPQMADNELREHMLGIFEHRSWDDFLTAVRNGEPITGGEEMHEYANRVSTALARILNTHGNDNRLLVVAHGGTFHSLMRIYGHERHECFIPNATPHHWHPDDTLQPMPWRVSLFEQTESGVETKPAPICPSLVD